MTSHITPIGVAALITLGALLASGGANASAASIEGVWARDDGQVRARVTRCGAKFCATNIWVKDPQGEEKVGDRIIAALSATGPWHWTGSAFDVRRKLTFEIDVSGSASRMTTHVCASSLCRDAAWTRSATGVVAAQ